MRRIFLYLIMFISFVNISYSNNSTDNIFSANNLRLENALELMEIDTTQISISLQLSDYNGFEVSIPEYNDGIIDLTVSGGLPPYSYYWSNNETTEDIGGLCEGAYTVWVFDANNSAVSESVVLRAPYEQEIILNQGWSIISTNLFPISTNLDNIFSDIMTSLSVVKDEYGNFYWPLYSVNFIGNWLPAEGYLINMISSDTLIVRGEMIQPETIDINVPVGWSIFGYIRNESAPIDQMLESISTDIEIVKNSNGDIYWPPLNFNNIGDMIPSEGYQVKMITQRNLVFPANSGATCVQICPNHMIDFDYNIYEVAQIGNQCWMKENLKVTHYSNGDSLVDGTGAGNINGDITTKYFFNYNDDISNSDVFGKLYSWNAMVNGSPTAQGNDYVQGVCPTGWHIPSVSEWNELFGFVDSQYSATDSEWNNSGNIGSDAGGNLKETGINNWITPNTGGTDLFGFTALPAGYRMITGVYMNLGENAYFWVNQEQYTFYSHYRKLSYSNDKITSGFYSKSNAMSVRCLKNL